MFPILRCVFVVLPAIANANAANPATTEGISNVALVKEFPVSLHVRHAGGNTFVPKASLPSWQLEQLRKGKTLATLGEAGAATSAEHSELFHTITNNISLPIDKEPRNGMIGLYGYEDVVKGTITYPNWSVDEILRYHLKATKWAMGKLQLQIRLISWIELLAENAPKISNLPESFSNKQRWLDNGLTIRQQPGDNCGWYAHGLAFDAALINKGYKNPKLNVAVLENRNSDNFGSLDNILKAFTKAPAPDANGTKYNLSNFTIRSCRGFPLSVNHTDFPVWLRKKIRSENKLHPSEWRLINQDLLRYEIAQGRPVVLATLFPNAKSFNNPENPTLNGDIVMRKGFKGQNWNAHCIVVSGYKPDPENPNEVLFEFINSWGPNWGNKGSAWISSSYLNINEVHETRAYSIAQE